MATDELILDSSYAPSFQEISAHVAGEGHNLWLEMNRFLQDSYKSKPKITYSKCAAKPGWNIKYQKSGKSLCTLYPDSLGFVALVVVSTKLLPAIIARENELAPEVLDLACRAKPFNGTIWLMVPVYKNELLQSVKLLLGLKYDN